eukprot:8184705-Pyramimonas_sp.AAC.1
MPGTRIDMFMISEALSRRIEPPYVLEDTGTFPHVPVALPLRGQERDMWVRQLAAPRAVPRGPVIGCSRYPGEWDGALHSIRQACDARTLQVAWDDVIAALEEELLERHDKVGPADDVFR